MGRLLLYVVPLLLTVYAFIDALLANRAELRAVPKLIWLPFILFVPIVGPVTYLLLGRRNRWLARSANGGGTARGWSGPAYQVTAPDDDPEFLRRLDRRNIDRRRRQAGRDGTDSQRAHRNKAAEDAQNEAGQRDAPDHEPRSPDGPNESRP